MGKRYDQTRHMNEEEDFLPERIITAEMTGLSEQEVKSFLIRGVSHSEIRTGNFVEGKFIPGDFIDSLTRKKEYKNVPIINAVGQLSIGSTLIINSPIGI